VFVHVGTRVCMFAFVSLLRVYKCVCVSAGVRACVYMCTSRYLWVCVQEQNPPIHISLPTHYDICTHLHRFYMNPFSE